MTTSVTSVSVDSILRLTRSLSAADKATLLKALIQETEISIFLDNHQTARNVSMQISGLDNAGIADVMSAIAESLRNQQVHHN